MYTHFDVITCKNVNTACERVKPKQVNILIPIGKHLTDPQAGVGLFVRWINGWFLNSDTG
jgi:hypothetical protein